MQKRVKKLKLGRKKSHRDSLKKNFLRSIFTYGYIKSTSVRVRVIKSEVLSLINKVKNGTEDANMYKFLTSLLGNRGLVDKCVKYSKGSLTGVTVRKIGYRSGDNTQMSKIELLGFEKKKKGEVRKVEKKVVDKKTVLKKDTKRIEKKRTDIGKSIKETFAGRKERARTRSGL